MPGGFEQPTFRVSAHIVTIRPARLPVVHAFKVIFSEAVLSANSFEINFCWYRGCSEKSFYKKW